MNRPHGSAGRSVSLALVIDRSGSMLGDGKMQAVNHAVGEMLPHLARLARWIPVQVDVIAFADSPAVHQAIALPSDQWRYEPIEAVPQGLTETGPALALAVQRLASRPPLRAIVLVSDGRPTDLSPIPFDQAVASIEGDIVTIALALGRDADRQSLARFARGVPPRPCADALEVVAALQRLTAELAGLVGPTGPTGPVEHPARPVRPGG